MDLKRNLLAEDRGSRSQYNDIFKNQVKWSQMRLPKVEKVLLCCSNMKSFRWAGSA